MKTHNFARTLTRIAMVSTLASAMALVACSPDRSRKDRLTRLTPGASARKLSKQQGPAQPPQNAQASKPIVPDSQATVPASLPQADTAAITSASGVPATDVKSATPTDAMQKPAEVLRKIVDENNQKLCRIVEVVDGDLKAQALCDGFPVTADDAGQIEITQRHSLENLGGGTLTRIKGLSSANHSVVKFTSAKSQNEGDAKNSIEALRTTFSLPDDGQSIDVKTLKVSFIDVTSADKDSVGAELVLNPDQVVVLPLVEEPSKPAVLKIRLTEKFILENVKNINFFLQIEYDLKK
ncbi:MAG: hypothetical protein ABL927_05645 [Bdellovibrionales bacterium]